MQPHRDSDPVLRLERAVFSPINYGAMKSDPWSKEVSTGPIVAEAGFEPSDLVVMSHPG